MDDTGELTNVPDYQKIRQTTQVTNSPGKSEHSDWNEDVETLTPSPVVRPPKSNVSVGRSMPQPQYANYGTWSGKPATANLGGSKVSWESHSPQYNPSRYGLLPTSQSMSSIKENSFLPQGFSQPVAKYVDTSGVERRIIRRANASPNRKSYTEGFLRDSTEFSIPENRLSRSSSQRNINEGYMVHTRDSGFADGTHTMRSPRQNATKGSYSPQTQIDDQWKHIGIIPGKNSPSQEDLRHWQQQHQEELLHQHLETQALYESPEAHAANTSFKQLSLQDESPARWEPVRRAADNIIREKNMIIDKLKNRILELEEDFRVSEGKLRQALFSKEDDADIVKQKLKEMQHKNLNLKEHLDEERATRNSEIDSLEVKLGASEHKVQQLTEVLRNNDIALADIKTQIEDKRLEAEAWRSKFEESRNGHQSMKKKLDSLQHYLDDLPTVEESRAQAQQSLAIREENVGLKNRLESLEKKVSNLRKIVTSRDFRIRELEDKEKELLEKLSETEDEIEKLRDSEGSEFYSTQRELKSCKAEKERLTIDLEKAKKLLETTHQKLRHVEVKYQSEMRTAEDRIAREEEAGEAMRAEVKVKEEQVDSLKKSIKELGQRNQELLEQNLLVRESARHMEASSSDSNLALHRRFMLQLGLCFSELQALVKVCSQRAQGQDPDISVLLSVHHSEPDSDSSGAVGGKNGEETMSNWLSNLGELRREIDRMRAHICNKYAEDIGDNIMCATQ